jgi:hypothetical protein
MRIIDIEDGLVIFSRIGRGCARGRWWMPYQSVKEQAELIHAPAPAAEARPKRAAQRKPSAEARPKRAAQRKPSAEARP